MEKKSLKVSGKYVVGTEPLLLVPGDCPAEGMSRGRAAELMALPLARTGDGCTRNCCVSMSWSACWGSVDGQEAVIDRLSKSVGRGTDVDW